MRRSVKPSPYDVHPGVEMIQKWIASLPEKTGRSLDDWVALVKASGPPTEKERRDWLKTEHGLGTYSALWIAERSGGKGGESDDPGSYLQTAAIYVEDMFAGKKAAIRPIYDELLRVAKSLGPDVKACPRKTIVPLYRRHVFAQIKPTTNTRVDLGLALKNPAPTGRLVDTGGAAKKDRITHRIPVAQLAEIDGEVLHWLKTAYDLDADD